MRDLENLKNEEAMTRVRSQSHSKKKKAQCTTTCLHYGGHTNIPNY